MDTVPDALGTPHPRGRADARIVSLVPSITELLVDLGLADRLVGRTGFCIHPRDAVKRIPKVGGTKDVDVDAIRRIAPTHVIVNVDENRRETADALGEFVPHVVVTHPLAPLDNLALYRLCGALFDRDGPAEALCARFMKAHAGAEAAGRELPPENVLYLIWKDPWMSVSPDTYISRTLALVGWHTVPRAAAGRYPVVELDTATLTGVARVLLSTEPYMFRDPHVAEVARLTARPVALIDGEATSWYGSRAIAGLTALAGHRRRLLREAV
jgi:ABC-type Fe3+-hydroxamate transport system substrate-binding protein